MKAGRGSRRLYFGEARGIAPEALEIVEAVRFRQHDVHRDVPEVRQNPICTLAPLAVVVAAELLLEGIHDRFGLHAVLRRADDEIVHERRMPAHVQNDDVGALALPAGFRSEPGAPQTVLSLDGAVPPWDQMKLL